MRTVPWSHMVEADRVASNSASGSGGVIRGYAWRLLRLRTRWSFNGGGTHTRRPTNDRVSSHVSWCRFVWALLDLDREVVTVLQCMVQCMPFRKTHVPVPSLVSNRPAVLAMELLVLDAIAMQVLNGTNYRWTYVADAPLASSWCF